MAETAYGVDFVDENDAGGVLLALFEEVAHARGADADEHFDEVGARDGEEGHAGLAGHGARHEGLAGAWGADEQDALGNAAAEAGELLGVGEELHDFGEFLLGLVHAGHVGEGDPLLVVLVEQLGAGPAEAERLAAGASLHLAHEEDPHADEQEHGEPADEQGHVPGLAVGGLGLDLHLLVEQA